MPRIKLNEENAVDTNTETQDAGLAARIQQGRAVPILSDEMMMDLVLTGYQNLVERYAHYVGYPLEDRHNLRQ
ncbi:MAG: hypothetical protein AAF629_06295, partial [Chloroflexota bacterium]